MHLVVSETTVDSHELIHTKSARSNKLLSIALSLKEFNG
jgi:hypothetical protein